MIEIPMPESKKFKGEATYKFHAWLIAFFGMFGIVIMIINEEAKLLMLIAPMLLLTFILPTIVVKMSKTKIERSIINYFDEYKRDNYAISINKHIALTYTDIIHLDISTGGITSLNAKEYKALREVIEASHRIILKNENNEEFMLKFNKASEASSFKSELRKIS